MGPLANKGRTLPWRESLPHQAHVKKHGVLQFLHIYSTKKDRLDNTFLWGDEVESMIVTLDKGSRKSALSLRSTEILDKLNETMKQISKDEPDTVIHAHFVPEYGSHMVEATPGLPYGGTTADLVLVEANMKLRRQMISEVLLDNERMMTICAFPRMGVLEFTDPPHAPTPVTGTVSKSVHLPDQVISSHPRFSTLTANIRERRGSKVDIRVPLYQDQHTTEAAKSFFQRQLQFAATGTPPSSSSSSSSSPASDSETKTESKASASDVVQVSDVPPDYDPTKEIYMDAMGFGMGCCCLQVTFQARTIREGRHLYDHLAVLAPVMMALSAASPFMCGRISDLDVRWTVISQSVDDRTPEERGLQPIPPNSPLRLINKSRYDSIDCYISQEDNFKPEYNDLDLVYDAPTYEMLINGGVDDLLAKHIAHLFIRDPLVIYEKHIYIDDTQYTDHFENIQSTNWQTVRFKPPPPDDDRIGWRVEFRSTEVQITDFENAAFTVFIALISRAILFFDLNLYIPISKVDENMRRAHKRDATRTEKFAFRKSIQTCQTESKETSNEYEDMTMKEIMCGKGAHPGLIPLVKSYLDIIKCETGSETRKVVDSYLELIRARACGELLTFAQWARRFVDLHPGYKKDSIITDEICCDLMETIDGINNGTISAPQLHGELNVHDSKLDTSGDIPQLLSTDRFTLDLQGGCGKLKALLAQYHQK